MMPVCDERDVRERGGVGGVKEGNRYVNTPSHLFLELLHPRGGVLADSGNVSVLHELDVDGDLHLLPDLLVHEVGVGLSLAYEGHEHCDKKGRGVFATRKGRGVLATSEVSRVELGSALSLRSSRAAGG